MPGGFPLLGRPNPPAMMAMKQSVRNVGGGFRSAVFLSPGACYHADRCEPLREAVRRGEVRLAALARRGYPGRRMPAGMLPEVSTVGFWDGRGAQSWGLDWHRNEGIELTFLARGQIDFSVDRQRFRLQAGNLTVTRPWQRHRLGDPRVGPSRLHWLILDVGVRRPNQTWVWPDWLVLTPDDLARLTNFLSHNEQCVRSANSEIAGCFEQIAELVGKRNPAEIQSRLRLHINELLVALLELLQRRHVPLDPRLVSSRRTVELFLADLKHHFDHMWTLTEMAEQCGLGRTRFADYCRQLVNMSPADYLHQCRIDAARKQLASYPGRSVTEIALACGFQTSQYFATSFRKHTGLTPRDFRKSAGPESSCA